MFGSGGFDVCIVINGRLNSNKFKEEVVSPGIENFGY